MMPPDNPARYLDDWCTQADARIAALEQRHALHSAHTRPVQRPTSDASTPEVLRQPGNVTGPHRHTVVMSLEPTYDGVVYGWTMTADFDSPPVSITARFVDGTTQEMIR